MPNIKRISYLGIALIFTVIGAISAPPVFAQPWTTVGPYGGDARSFAYSPSNPSHILLGTTNGWIYQSNNGRDWSRLAKVGSSDMLVVDHILFDESNPTRLMVGAWRMDRPDGGIFISDDAGRQWKPVPDMKGTSVRALAQASSDPKVFVAGTLKGVYRSQDGGLHWTLISPPGSTEIHEVESIAIDPMNPQVIYAGTWHLPWKTTDGGKTWQSIKKGLIVDSDVFSIIIDPKAPSVVYASACSGIYKSFNGGAEFRKIQGIPSSARRTRVLKQDPANPNIVYAGTTEGLYRTVDAGTKWTLMTPKYYIINDIYVDPKNPQHILLATDRGGVLESENGAVSFQAANNGFSERQVSSMVVDPQAPATVYAGVLNDKRYGGVFVSKDAGRTWSQISAGLDDDDVFSLAVSPTGVLLAGTNSGIYRLQNGAFENVGHRMKKKVRKVSHYRKKHRYYTTETTWVPDGKIDEAVHGLAYANGEWYAATASGIYRSDDRGLAWREGLARPDARFRGIAAHGSTVIANGSTALYVSQDQGKDWTNVTLPAAWNRVRRVAVDTDGRLWAAGRLGVAYSDNQGQSWQKCDLPINNINGLAYDPVLKRVVVSSYDSDVVFGIDPAAKNWVWWNPGWRTRFIRSAQGSLVASTLFHGIVLEPANQQLAAGGM